MRLLFFGDVFGRPGREAVKKILPELREEFRPDFIVANVENMSHGKGVTVKHMQEMKDVGIDGFTSGNHVFDKREEAEKVFASVSNITRPDNYGSGFPGSGAVRLQKGAASILLLNLNGRVFFEKQFEGAISNPFTALDSLLEREAQGSDIILLDLHAEATSEKVAMGLYADGRVSAVFGTHTHVGTSDTQVLPKGTAYVTDVGMCGPKGSVIGVQAENVISAFRYEEKDEV